MYVKMIKLITIETGRLKVRPKVTTLKTVTDTLR